MDIVSMENAFARKGTLAKTAVNSSNVDMTAITMENVSEENVIAT